MSVGSSRIYSEDELLEEQPNGEVLIRKADGQVFKTFVCYGCQTCFEFTDDACEHVSQAYPHFLAPPEPQPDE